MEDLTVVVAFHDQADREERTECEGKEKEKEEVSSPMSCSLLRSRQVLAQIKARDSRDKVPTRFGSFFAPELDLYITRTRRIEWSARRKKEGRKEGTSWERTDITHGRLDDHLPVRNGLVDVDVGHLGRNYRSEKEVGRVGSGWEGDDRRLPLELDSKLDSANDDHADLFSTDSIDFSSLSVLPRDAISIVSLRAFGSVSEPTSSPSSSSLPISPSLPCLPSLLPLLQPRRPP